MSGSYNRLLLSCDCDENYHKPHSGFMVGIAQVLPTDGCRFRHHTSSWNEHPGLVNSGTYSFNLEFVSEQAFCNIIRLQTMYSEHYAIKMIP